MRFNKVMVLLSMVGLLAACGGGGKDEDEQDEDGQNTLPEIRLSAEQVQEEDAGRVYAVINVTLNRDAEQAVQVHYATVDDTATAGSDYTAAEGDLTIAAGNRTAVIEVPVHGDTVIEADEQFIIRLSNVQNATLAETQLAVTILNDDEEQNAVVPALAIADAEIAEGQDGTQNLIFSVSLSAAYDKTVRVNYATQNGSALAGEDYQAAEGLLSIAAGQTAATVTVVINGDSLVESDEQFSVLLSNPVNATLADEMAAGIIRNDDAASIIGLDGRPANTSCLASGVSNNTEVKIEYPYPNIGISQEFWTAFINPGWDADKWFFTELFTGAFGWIDYDDHAGNQKTVLMNLPIYKREVNDEGGLLGMTFDPDFPENGYVYFSFTATPNAGESGAYFTSVIARYTLNTSTYAVQANSRLDILRLAQPYGNHNGGDIHFGPDGYLYIGFGDGGLEHDPNGNAQNPHNFFGAMLRIDVSGASQADPYDIPSDNPYAPGAAGEGQGAPEVWAYGFRNPWRWNFDSALHGGQLWLADVGETLWEEVNVVEKGKNYGWPCREGAHVYAANAGRSFCSGKVFIDPVAEFPHNAEDQGDVPEPEVISIVGGFVYRGGGIPALAGSYIVADSFAVGNLSAVKPIGEDQYEVIALGTGANTFTFGQDDQGEIYGIKAHNGIYRLALDSGGGNPGPESQLSQTGCVNPSHPSQPASGVIPFSINEPFWSDHADKERFVALPDGAELQIDGEGDLIFPVGSVLMKHFRLSGRLIETRLLMHQSQGIWEGFSYEWNAAQSEANLLSGGKTVNIDGQDWIYPSRSDCLACHTSVAGRALGPELKQLNREHHYPSTDRNADQLATWEYIGYFNRALTLSEKQLALTPSRANPDADLSTRARSYLHSNCAQCHQGAGSPSGVNIDFRAHIAFANMNICNQTPARGDLGIIGARLLKPGNSAESILYVRVANNNANRMPPLGSNELDDEAIQLLNEWIGTMASCDL